MKNKLLALLITVAATLAPSLASAVAVDPSDFVNAALADSQ